MEECLHEYIKKPFYYWKNEKNKKVSFKMRWCEKCHEIKKEKDNDSK
jgi:hypothetical protein